MRSGYYSGGMKRRLSVAVSLIGSPSIVFLDEPVSALNTPQHTVSSSTVEYSASSSTVKYSTEQYSTEVHRRACECTGPSRRCMQSTAPCPLELMCPWLCPLVCRVQTTGMDPVARRYVWSIIERAKRGRAIVLTTHSMEEADILGNRIAIMAKGRLRCIGTSIHLKQRFGAGIIVTLGVGKPLTSQEQEAELAEEYEKNGGQATEDADDAAVEIPKPAVAGNIEPEMAKKIVKKFFKQVSIGPFPLPSLPSPFSWSGPT